MCKILLRGPLEPVLPDDPREALKKFKPGDLIAAVPDDHVFGRDECAPLFAILSVPDMSVEEASLLCAPPRDVVDGAGAVVQFAPRAAVNLALEAVTEDVTRAEFLDTITLNPLLENPAVIGPPSSELG